MFKVGDIVICCVLNATRTPYDEAKKCENECSKTTPQWCELEWMVTSVQQEHVKAISLDGKILINEYAVVDNELIKIAPERKIHYSWFKSLPFRTELISRIASIE